MISGAVKPAPGSTHRAALQAGEGSAPKRGMKELLRSNDLVKLSWIEALLADSGIAVLVLDQHTSVLEGSAGAIPRRVMVADEDYARARNVLESAGEGAELGR